jgi:hypothetical protein
LSLFLVLRNAQRLLSLQALPQRSYTPAPGSFVQVTEQATEHERAQRLRHTFQDPGSRGAHPTDEQEADHVFTCDEEQVVAALTDLKASYQEVRRDMTQS